MILLIRHCTPNINYERCDFLEATERIKTYNFTQDVCLDEITSLRSQIDVLFGNNDFDIFTSSSSRALITAQVLFLKKAEQITISDDFLEFDLAIFPIPVLKVKFKTWILISRIMWVIGLLKTNRSFLQERLRAVKGAQILVKNAKKNNCVSVSWPTQLLY